MNSQRAYTRSAHDSIVGTKRQQSFVNIGCLQLIVGGVRDLVAHVGCRLGRSQPIVRVEQHGEHVRSSRTPSPIQEDLRLVEQNQRRSANSVQVHAFVERPLEQDGEHRVDVCQLHQGRPELNSARQQEAPAGHVDERAGRVRVGARCARRHLSARHRLQRHHAAGAVRRHGRAEQRSDARRHVAVQTLAGSGHRLSDWRAHPARLEHQRERVQQAAGQAQGHERGERRDRRSHAGHVCRARLQRQAARAHEHVPGGLVAARGRQVRGRDHVEQDAALAQPLLCRQHQQVPDNCQLREDRARQHVRQRDQEHSSVELSGSAIISLSRALSLSLSLLYLLKT